MRFHVVGALLGLAAAAPSQSPAVAQAIAEAEALGAVTGVVAYDDAGNQLVARRADELFAPASNMKVLTAAAVLRGLSPDHYFATRFELVDGALVVRASGDPNWITGTVHDPRAIFGEVAAALQRLGVRSLRTITLDAGVFTGPGRPPTWPQDQLFTAYCAPTGPFVLEQGTFGVRIDPQGGTPVAELVAPPAGVAVRSSVEAVARRGVSTCGAIDRGDHVLVRGKLSQRSAPVTIHTAVEDPAGWYERTLAAVLAASGIAVGAADPAAEDGLVHEHTTTLAPALLRMLEDSSNFDAEQLLRVLGAASGDGSLAGGVQAMRKQLEIGGPLPDGAVLVDGSGLSRGNRVTPRFVVDVLRRTAALPGGKLLRESLPIAGRTGTLEDRFTNSTLADHVHAKTGWIRGVSALSGFAELPGGGVVTFAILMAYDPKKSGLNKELKAAQEHIVEALCRVVQ